MIKILYIILFINCFVNAFIRRSKGSLFYSRNAKSLSQLIHYIVLITLIIIAGINYSWMHLIYMILADCIAYTPFAYICKKIVG